MKYSDLPLILINLTHLVKYSMFSNSEDEARFLEHLRFMRMVMNQNDNMFTTMLVERIKKEVYLDVLFSLIERSKTLSKAILVEMLWLFIGFFTADKRIINELINKAVLECLAELISTEDMDILENVRLLVSLVFFELSWRQQQRESTG